MCWVLVVVVCVGGVGVMNVGWFVVWFVFFKYWVLIWIEFLCEY